MKKTGIFYGSTTGTTAEAARRIAAKLGVKDSDIYNVNSVAPDKVADYEILILGTSTWGAGDLQGDWYDFVAGMSAMDLKGKKIALFGTGDETMSDTFCNAVGELYDKLADTGAEFIGSFNVDGFNFEHSAAVKNGKAVGLLLDEVNHAAEEEARITAWTDQVMLEA